MSNILIDGELKKSEDLNPRFHVYIGMFRPPKDLVKKYSDFDRIYMPDTLYGGLGKSFYEDYSSGYFDIPQYKTDIEEKYKHYE